MNTTEKNKQLLIIGCGYVGHRFADLMLSVGWNVTALTRSSERAKLLKHSGITPVIGDVLDADSLTQLPAADHCLYAVGYDRTAKEDKRDVYVNGLKNVLQQLLSQQSPPRLTYVSSTSVYGQNAGEWVNEDSVTDPDTESGQICLAAENVAREIYSTNTKATILRLSGIYGPGRLIGRKQQLMEKQVIPGNPQGWLNLIHVADILRTLQRLMLAEPESDLYLLSDKTPYRRIEFYSELAKVLNAPPPIMQTSEESASLGKRCDSSRLRQEFSLTLKYPTIQYGLKASI